MSQRTKVEERRVRALERIADALGAIAKPQSEGTRNEHIRRLSNEARDWRVKYRKAQAELEELQANGHGGTQ